MNVNSVINRRKTPSELRGEQLKRKNVIEVVDVPTASSLGNTGGENQGLKNHNEIPRIPRYIETRVDEVHPVKKPRFRKLSGKKNGNTSTGQIGSLRNLSLISNLTAKRRDQITGLEGPADSSKVAKDDMQSQQTIEKCSQNVFRSVTELSSRGGSFSDLGTVDLDNALKGLAPRETNNLSGLRDVSLETTSNPLSADFGNFNSECRIAGSKAPLDLTLKTSIRIMCSSSMNWFHRLIRCGAYYGLPQVLSQFGYSGQNTNCTSATTPFGSHLNRGALYSWVYPQSSLPPSLVSSLTLSAANGVETDFLSKRQTEWEDAFRSLYYILRKGLSHIFYVCTSHFVVMFTAVEVLGKASRSCNAYISQSTRILRSLLKKHDVSFSMPLCHSKVEQVTAEDLAELSEIEKHNLGQTRRMISSSDVDNSPESLLAFSGNENVQGLYEFLLNYRSILTFLAGMDVPVLYSPVPFRNAALSMPEVRYIESKTVDHIAASARGSDVKEPSSLGQSAGLRCSIEIKDAYLPPWIISSICATISSEGKSFEASFTTEPSTVGLNVSLQAVSKESKSQVDGFKGFLRIPETVIIPELYLSSLKGLKYCNDSYIASLSHVSAQM